MREFHNYVPWADAAREIDLYWSTHYLHKQNAERRIDRSKILVIYDPSLAKQYPSTGGRTMFLHRTEIARFKAEVYPKIKKRKDMTGLCPGCRKPMHDCAPCKWRKDVKINEETKRRDAIRSTAGAEPWSDRTSENNGSRE